MWYSGHLVKIEPQGGPRASNFEHTSPQAMGERWRGDVGEGDAEAVEVEELEGAGSER